jgi:hypothetical protein
MFQVTFENSRLSRTSLHSFIHLKSIDSPSPLTSTPSQIFRCVFGNGDGTRLWVGDSGAHLLHSPQPVYECHGTHFSLPTLIYVMLFFGFLNVFLIHFWNCCCRRYNGCQAGSEGEFLYSSTHLCQTLNWWPSCVYFDAKRIEFRFVEAVRRIFWSLAPYGRRLNPKVTSSLHLMDDATHKIMLNNTKASWIVGFNFRRQT